MRCAGSGGTNNGRSSRTRSFRIVIPCSQPIRSAITVAGIDGNSREQLADLAVDRVDQPNPARARSYFGGVVERNASRTVFRAIPSRSTIALMLIFSAR